MLASALRLPSRGTQAGPGRATWGEQAAGGAAGHCWGDQGHGEGLQQSWAPGPGRGRGGSTCASLPQLCQCHPSLAPVPVPGASLGLQLPVLTQEEAFPILEATFLHTTALAMLICSRGWGTWTSPLRLPLDWHPHQAQGGRHSSVFPSLSPCLLRPSDDYSQGCLCAGVLAPAWCACAQVLPDSRDVGARLGVSEGMLDQGWVSQRGHGSRAGCPGRAGAGPASPAHATARFPHMKMFGWKLSAASCLLGATRICRCLQCLMSSSRG